MHIPHWQKEERLVRPFHSYFDLGDRSISDSLATDAATVVLVLATSSTRELASVLGIAWTDAARLRYLARRASPVSARFPPFIANSKFAEHRKGILIDHIKLRANIGQ